MSTGWEWWRPHDGGWLKGGGDEPTVWSPTPPLTPRGAVRPYLPYEVNPGWTAKEIVEVDRLEVVVDMVRAEFVDQVTRQVFAEMLRTAETPMRSRADVQVAKLEVQIVQEQVEKPVVTLAGKHVEVSEDCETLVPGVPCRQCGHRSG